MSFSGGVTISKTDTSLYSTEKVGDVILYTGTSNQTLFIGNADIATPTITVQSNMDVKFGKDIISTNVNATGAVNLYMGGISASEVDVSVEGTIARNSAAASNHTFVMGTVSGVASWEDISALSTYNVEYGAVMSTYTSNVGVEGYITIGSNANVDYPLHVQTIGTGNISIMAEGDISGLSDQRVKRDLVAIPDALGKIDMISGYTFAWIHDTAAEPVRSAGVIAQEMAAALPEVVKTDPTSGHLHVSYGNISALLIQAIKELKHKTVAIEVTCTSVGDTIDELLPDRKALIGDPDAEPWRVAFISAASEDADVSGAFVYVSEDGQSLQGRCDAPGKYTVLVSV